MASRLKLRLPSLRVTQRSTTGEVNHRLIPRGCTSQAVQTTDESHPLCDNDGVDGKGDSVMDKNKPVELPDQQFGVVGMDSGTLSTSINDEPSLHVLAQKASIASWNKLRPIMLKTAIECNAMPLNQMCVICNTNEAIYRCLRCAPWAHFCQQCFEDAHKYMNVFHTGEVWEVATVI